MYSKNANSSCSFATGPWRLISSALSWPMVDSASALSYESLTLPTDATAPTEVSVFADEVDEHGRRLVVRNGYHAEREVDTAAGAVPVRQPRVAEVLPPL
jgi:hypothetical protein